jgi:hypothetical protein
MLNGSPHVIGELRHWPTKERMAEILKQSGLTPVIGRYSVRIEDFSHFVFQQYGPELSPPAIDADAASEEDMLRETKQVSEALSRASISHRFEVYGANNELIGYFHHQWPVKLWCDFNACGWSGEPDDHCYYAFKQDQLEELNPTEGMEVLLYMEDSPEDYTTCRATMERWKDRWRARPSKGTWEHTKTI